MEIDKFLDDIIEKFNITEHDSQHLKGSAFEIFAPALILNEPYIEIIENVWTKKVDSMSADSEDGGFDGISIQEKDEEIKIDVFQMKRKDELSLNNIRKFKNDFEDIFLNGGIDTHPNSSAIRDKVKECYLYSDSGKSMTFNLYYVYAGENSNHADAYSNAINELDFNRNNVNASIIDMQKLKDLLVTDKNRENVEFSFNIVDGVFVKPTKTMIEYKLNDEIMVYTVVINSQDLIDMIQREKDINKTLSFLYFENVRGYLGTRGSVNDGIKKSIIDIENHPKFYLYNNGITIVTENVKFEALAGCGDSGTLKIKNPVIINGLQTTQTLFELREQATKKLFILCKIFVIPCEYDEREELISKITTSTNSQNKIEIRDQLSNKKFQKELEKRFKIDGIKYLRKTKQIFSNADYSTSEVEAEQLLKYWYAINIEPGIAKNNKTKVLKYISDILDDKIVENKNLFKPEDLNYDLLYSEMKMTYEIMSYVQEKNLQNKEPHFRHSSEAMCYLINKLLKTLPIEIDEAYNRANLIILKCIEREKSEMENKGYEYSNNTFFKSSRIKEYIDEEWFRE